MDERGRPAADGPVAPADPPPADATSDDPPNDDPDHPITEPGDVAWAAALPPPPFVDPESVGGTPRLAPLSPRVGVLILAAVLVGVLLWMARDAVRPFVVGLLLVYLLDPPVRWLSRIGLPRTLSIVVVYVIAIVVIVELLNLMLTPLVNEVVRFAQDLPALVDQLELQVERVSELYARLQIPDEVRDWIDAMVVGIGQNGTTPPPIGITDLFPVLTGAGGILGALFGYILLPVWIFYLLKDRVALTEQFDRSIPATWRFDVWAVIRMVRRLFGQWVRAQLILGATVGIFTFIGLLILNELVDPVFGRYAVLLSITAGVLELLPIIGPIIAAVPAVLLAATAGLEPVIAALVLYTLVQQVENNLLVPKIQGDAIDMHPALVMFAIVIGGALGGLLGAILALPIAAAIRDVLRYLFRRLSPESPEALASSIAGLRLVEHPGPRGHR